MKYVLGMVLVLAGLGTLAAAQQHPMREGRWEVTVHMDVPGLPTPMPPTTATQCITKAQLEDPTKAIAGAGAGATACKVDDYKVEANKISWKIACSGEQSMTGEGEILFKGDTYAGVVKMQLPQGPMTMKYEGKRLGDCTP